MSTERGIEDVIREVLTRVRPGREKKTFPRRSHHVSVSWLMDIYRQGLFLALHSMGLAEQLLEGKEDAEGQYGFLVQVADMYDDDQSVDLDMGDYNELRSNWERMDFNPPSWIKDDLETITDKVVLKCRKMAMKCWIDALQVLLPVGETTIVGYATDHYGLMSMAKLSNEDFGTALQVVENWENGGFRGDTKGRVEPFHLTFLCRRYKNNMDAVVRAMEEAWCTEEFAPIDPRTVDGMNNFFSDHESSSDSKKDLFSDHEYKSNDLKDFFPDNEPKPGDRKSSGSSRGELVVKSGNMRPLWSSGSSGPGAVGKISGIRPLWN